MALHNLYGTIGELVAAQYLRERGYVIVERNWVGPGRKEIDIIARKDETYVFVEVKARSVEINFKALQAVTAEKRQHILAVARAYLLEHHLGLRTPHRYDIITVVGLMACPTITHYIDAFRRPPRRYRETGEVDS